MLLWTTHIDIWVSNSRVISQRVFLERVKLVLDQYISLRSYILLFPFLINGRSLSSDGTLLRHSNKLPRLRLN